MEQQIGNVRVVEQAMEVLFAIARQDQPQGLRPFAEQLEISKTTLQRILASLQRTELIAFNPGRNSYSLTSKSLFLAASYQRDQDLVGMLRPSMEAIRAESGETVTLSIAVDGYRVTILQIESPHDLRLTTQPGRPYPIVLGATGRVLLSQMPPSVRRPIIAKYGDHVTLGTGEVKPINPEDLERSVQEVERVGSAVSYGEWSDGGVGLSVPIHTGQGPSSALSVYGVENRISPERAAAVIDQLLAVSRKFSRDNDTERTEAS